ncbi:hypothetical protein ACEPAF_3469 [Sanghuangporus sanghuang]
MSTSSSPIPSSSATDTPTSTSATETSETTTATDTSTTSEYVSSMSFISNFHGNVLTFAQACHNRRNN